MPLSSIEDAIKDFTEGKPIIVVDDEDRENEGDLILAAEKATPENIAFMIRHSSGIICAPSEEERLDKLELPIMVEQNSDPLRTAFTVSTDYIRGMTTGVSAVERANTLRALADETVTAADFIKPGHIFPLKYRAGGVLVRRCNVRLKCCYICWEHIRKHKARIAGKLRKLYNCAHHLYWWRFQLAYQRLHRWPVDQPVLQPEWLKPCSG